MVHFGEDVTMLTGNAAVPFPVFMIAYRDGCPYCEQVGPVIAELPSVLQARGLDHVTVVAVDVTTASGKAALDHLGISDKISGVPHMEFVASATKHTPYSGPRTTNAMADFTADALNDMDLGGGGRVAGRKRGKRGGASRSSASRGGKRLRGGDYDEDFGGGEDEAITAGEAEALLTGGARGSKPKSKKGSKPKSKKGSKKRRVVSGGGEDEELEGGAKKRGSKPKTRKSSRKRRVVVHGGGDWRPSVASVKEDEPDSESESESEDELEGGCGGDKLTGGKKRKGSKLRKGSKPRKGSKLRGGSKGRKSRGSRGSKPKAAMPPRDRRTGKFLPRA